MSDVKNQCFIQEVAERGRVVYETLHLYDDTDCVNLYHGDGALPPHPCVQNVLKDMANKLELWNKTQEGDATIELRRYRVADRILIAQLREAIVKDFMKSMPPNFDGNNAMVHVGGGITQLVAALFHYFRYSNGNLLMFAPTYTSFVGSLSSMNSNVHLVKPTHDGKITPEHIKKALDEYTEIKAIFLINPNNPTGQYFSTDELEKIARLAIERDLIVIVDEVFHKLVFDTENKFVSMASIEIDGKSMFNRTITLRSVSKDHGLAAMRTGYAIGPREIMDKLKLSWFTFITTFSVDDLAQRVAYAALSHTPHEYYQSQQNLLRYHRDIVINWTEQINARSGYQPLKAEPVFAGIFQILDASGLRNQQYNDIILNTDITLFNALLQEENGGVALFPASCGGYDPGDLKIRITLSSSENDIRLGMKRLCDFILKLSHASP